MVRTIGSDTKRTIILHLDFDRLKSRGIVHPATARQPDSPSKEPRIPHPLRTDDVINLKPLAERGRLECDQRPPERKGEVQYLSF